VALQWEGAYDGPRREGGLALRARVPIVLLLLALPGTADAATVSVEPYVEPPLDDPYGTCSRYAMCPADMIVVSGAPAENSNLAITSQVTGDRRSNFVVRDRWAPVQAGPGCAQLDPQAVSCDAGVVGTVQLGDGDDWLASMGGDVYGGDGQDVLQAGGGRVTGGAGNDVLIGYRGAGGDGDDVVMAGLGFGDAGDDDLRCLPEEFWSCRLDGGPGDDLLTAGTSGALLLGRRGDDALRGGVKFDTLRGGRGNDLLVGGADGDHMRGESGADRLVSREDRSAGERILLDRVDCGAGRRDRAVADRRDDVKSCERVALPAPRSAG
jgi:Ca2+-binding RTX toxin-like protein